MRIYEGDTILKMFCLQWTNKEKKAILFGHPPSILA